MKQELWQTRIYTEKKTSELLEDSTQHCSISIDEKVLIIGPGVMPEQLDNGRALPMDPSVIMLSSYLSQGEGSLTVFDEPLGRGQSLHNWHLVKDCLDFFKEAGAALTQYTFKEGDILDPEALEGRFDVINDHFTWEWIMQFSHQYNYQENPCKLLASRYKELLREGGKVLLHFRFDPSRMEPLLEALLTEGFEIPAMYEGHDDLYEIKDKILLEELATRLTAGWLKEDRFLAPFHRANGMVVAYRP